MKLSTFIGGAVALASSAYGVQNATFCTDSNTICYSVNVPASTASNGGEGDLYFQISGPSTMRWIGFGQGDQMAGANMFVIYANAAGTNVTLSPRHGITEVEPLEDPTTNVTLLEGSGIANGQMVANVLCTSCNKWTGGDTMNFDNPQAGFIWSYLQGDPINSDSLSATITQHDLMGNANFDLATAAGGDSTNPFLIDAESGSGSGRGGPGPSSPVSPVHPSGGSAGASGGESTIGSKKYFRYLKAHGIIGPVTFVLLFPIGAIMIRLLSFPGLVYLHAAWQLIALALACVTLGLGLWLANTLDYRDRSHAIIGIVAISGILVQPFTGLAHHLIYTRRGRPNVATYPHVWWGRAFIILGIVNGGLGLDLADDTHGGKTAYIVVAALMGALWIGVDVLALVRGFRSRDGNGKVLGGGESTMRARPSESESPGGESRRQEMRFK